VRGRQAEACVDPLEQAERDSELLADLRVRLSGERRGIGEPVEIRERERAVGDRRGNPCCRNAEGLQLVHQLHPERVPAAKRLRRAVLGRQDPELDELAHALARRAAAKRNLFFGQTQGSLPP
jgi:hypothetical protein